MKEIGQVIVLAPDKPQSGMGHAITINDPIRLQQVDVFGDVEAYACSGTPVDCVKLAKTRSYITNRIFVCQVSTMVPTLLSISFIQVPCLQLWKLP